MFDTWLEWMKIVASSNHKHEKNKTLWLKNNIGLGRAVRTFCGVGDFNEIYSTCIQH